MKLIESVGKTRIKAFLSSRFVAKPRVVHKNGILRRILYFKRLHRSFALHNEREILYTFELRHYQISHDIFLPLLPPV